MLDTFNTIFLIKKYSSQNPPQIDSKLSKIGTWNGSGHPWAPPGGLLGTTWGPDAKNIKKVTWRTPPWVPTEVIFEHCLILCRVLFLVPVFVAFLATCWEPLGAEKVVVSLIASLKNRLWPFLKKLQEMSSNTTPCWYLLGAKFMIFMVSQSRQKRYENKSYGRFCERPGIARGSPEDLGSILQPPATSRPAGPATSNTQIGDMLISSVHRKTLLVPRVHGGGNMGPMGPWGQGGP